jgi:DNA ligase (NAD+)
LAEAEVPALAQLDDIGDVIAASVVNVLRSVEGHAMFEALERAGVDLTSAPQDGDAADSVFSGKRIVLTGTLEHFKRLELTQLLEGLGASVGSSIGPKTDLLIAGAKAGSKLAKAETLGIAVWDEARLVEQLAERE